MISATTISLSTRRVASVRHPIPWLARFREPRLGLAVLAIGVLVTVAYLLLVNDTATRGLSLESIEQERRQLAEETRQLEVDLANLQSFATVERAGQALDLTARVTPEFLVVPDGRVAVR